MQVVILANEDQKAELSVPVIQENADIKWIDTPADFSMFSGAAVYADLLFIPTKERVDLLSRLLPKTVVINAVTDCLSEIRQPFIRINGWPGFLSKEKIEAAANDTLKKEAEIFFSLLQKKPEWIPDTTGFIAPRVIAMIINEAYHALEEGVAAKKEIDTAMKLGTNYPYGPFQWSEMIGKNNILCLLQKLAQKDAKYSPSELLVTEALNKSI